MTLPQVVLQNHAKEPPGVSCPDVTIDGWRVPEILHVSVGAPFDDVARVTFTILAKVQYGCPTKVCG